MNVSKEVLPRWMMSCFLYTAMEKSSLKARETTEQATSELLTRLKAGDAYSWREVQERFPLAHEFLQSYAAQRGLNPFSTEGVLGYWIVGHNKILDRGYARHSHDLLPTFTDHCKTIVGLLDSINPLPKGLAQYNYRDVETGRGRFALNSIFDEPATSTTYIIAHRGQVALSGLGHERIAPYLEQRIENRELVGA